MYGVDPFPRRQLVNGDGRDGLVTAPFAFARHHDIKVEHAKNAGAQWFFSNVLFLMPSSAKQFLPFVREKFPKLAKQYEEWYGKNGYAPEEYRKKMSQRVAKIRQEYGFVARPWEERTLRAKRPQLSLGWLAGQTLLRAG